MNATRGSWVILALLAFEGASAAKPPAASERFAITAQRVLDIERGRYFEDSVVLVAGERIEKLVPRKALDPTLRIVDLGQVTLLPGLIDAHTHLLADTGDSYSAMLLTKSQAYRALEGAAHAKRTLHAGFTMVRDVESEGAQYADVALRDAIARGLVEGPRMRVATRGIAAVGQYMPFDISPDHAGFPRGAQLVSGVDEVRRAAREQLGNGADHLKVYADWEHPTLTLDEIRVAVEEAKKAGKRVVVHAITPEAIRNAVEAGAVSIEHGMFADRATLELLAKKRVWLVPTLTALADAIEDEESPEGRASMGELLKSMKANLALAHELGVPLAMGSDAATADAHGRNAREIVAMRDAGLPNLVALRAATTSGAALIGLEQDIGAIAPGRYADLIAVEGDPLADVAALARVVFVMKGGRVVRDEVSAPRRDSASRPR